MFKRTHTRREHFAAWLLCSSVAWLSGLACILVRTPADGASIPVIVGVVSVSVIITAVLFYGSRRKPEDILGRALALAYLHVIFFIGVIALFNIFVRHFSRWARTENIFLYDGTALFWRLYWPWFILATLVTISLIVYWIWGRALQLK